MLVLLVLVPPSKHTTTTIAAAAVDPKVDHNYRKEQPKRRAPPLNEKLREREREKERGHRPFRLLHFFGCSWTTPVSSPIAKEGKEKEAQSIWKCSGKCLHWCSFFPPSSSVAIELKIAAVAAASFSSLARTINDLYHFQVADSAAPSGNRIRECKGEGERAAAARQNKHFTLDPPYTMAMAVAVHPHRKNGEKKYLK